MRRKLQASSEVDIRTWTFFTQQASLVLARILSSDSSNSSKVTCASAHIAPAPVQKKKPAHTASLPSESARAAASDGLKSNGHPHGRLLASSSTASLINLPVGRPWRKSKAAKTADQQGRVPEQGLIEAIH